MKAKKWVTLITFSISAVSLICVFIANCACIDLMYDISMAIFGSALLGFIISLVEYFAERKNAMENFLSVVYGYYVKFRKLKYINYDEPKELILGCISEEQHNNYVNSFKSEIATELGLTITHKKRDEFISWIEENEFTNFSENDDIEAILIQIYNQRIENYKKSFAARMDMYIELSKMDFENLSNAYGNLDFLFANSSVRKQAYISIYSSLQSYCNKILSEVYHFNMVKEGQGNFAVCANKLLELNDYFFKVEKKNNSTEEDKIVYQHLFDNLSDSLVNFQAAIYFKKNPQYEEKHPVFGQTKKLENWEK